MSHSVKHYREMGRLVARAKELEAEGREVIYLCLGEPDFPTPVPVLAAAVNDAVRKVESNQQDVMKKLTGGISLPEGFKMPF